jgi:hypothetical protein
MEGGQSLLGEAFALLTMSIYLSWIHILLMLMVAALCSKTALWICIGKPLSRWWQEYCWGLDCNCYTGQKQVCQLTMHAACADIC